MLTKRIQQIAAAMIILTAAFIQTGCNGKIFSTLLEKDKTLMYMVLLNSTPAPALSGITITSSNTNPLYAKVGDTITFSFTSEKDILTPTVLVSGGTATVTGGPKTWTATYVMTSSETEGIITCTISNFRDTEGHAFLNVTNNSTVTFDRTAPSVVPVAFDQAFVNNANQSAISYTFSGAETGSTYSYTISDGVTTTSPATGNITTTNQQISPIDLSLLGLLDSNLSLSVYLTDPAGNISSVLSASISKDVTAPSNQDTVYPAGSTKGSGQPVTIVSSGSSTNEVWFAPVGTTTFVEGPTMTKASGIATTIDAPTTGGSYRIFVIDQYGNYSFASVAVLTVDAVAPADQDLVFAASTTKGPGQAVAITASSSHGAQGGAASDTVWFAPAGTTTFVAGPTMTSATGSAISINSPTQDGTYVMFVIDSVGNVSTASTAVLTVDATAPADQDSVFSAPVTVGGSKPVTISASSSFAGQGGSASDTVWLAPFGTTVFVANGTTITSAAGSATTITSPSTSGDYRIYVRDQYGNVSQPSLSDLTVDATAPTNQDTVFPSNVTDLPGATITIVSSGDSTNEVWFAPSGTSSFSAGTNMTKAASGTSTTILAPADLANYKLYVIDQYGNISAESTATLTVSNNITATISGQPSDPSKVTTLAITVGGSVESYRYKFGTSAINCTVDGGTYSVGDTLVATLITDDISGLAEGGIKVCVLGKHLGVEQLLASASSVTWTKDTVAPNNENTVFTPSKISQGGLAITIVSSGTASNQVWFAPTSGDPCASASLFTAGATMTQAASGTSTSINAPASDGTYYLYVIDAAGNISAHSTATLTVDNIAPTNQDTVFSASVSKQGGAAVTIVSSGDATNEVWFAPVGTTTFVAGATMTKAVSGTSTSILAPATAGNYRLFVIDAAGNISDASVAILTVDNTVPVLSSITPATSATVSTKAVSYTFSETCTSGSITWTETGGSDDPAGSPAVHTYNLSGSELNSGVHNLTLTSLALNDGTTYTVDFSGTDAAANTGTAQSTGVTYNSVTIPLTIVSAETMDLDRDGKIDHYKITFSLSISDATFPGYSLNALGGAATGWTVAGYNNPKLRHGTAVSAFSGGSVTDTADNTVIYLSFDENAGFDTGAKPDLTTSSTPGVKTATNVALAQVITTDVTEADLAKPIVVGSSGITTFTTLTVTFSEAVYGSAANNSCTSGSSGDIAATTITYADVNGSGATSASSMVSTDVCASDSGFNATYTVNSAFVSGDTADNINASASVYDAADNTGETSVTIHPNIIAATIPLITKIETFDSNNNGKIEQLKITFNKNMDDSTIPKTSSGQFLLNSVACEDVDSVTGGTSTISAPNNDPGSINDTVVTVFTNDSSVIGTGSLPLSFTTNINYWKAVGGTALLSVGDLTPFVVDKAPPVLMSAVAYENSTVGLTTIDSDDTIVLTFSESTNKVAFNTATISSGVDLDSVLAVSSGHSWGSDDAITSAVWNGAGNQLTVTFSGAGGTPATLSPGDTINIIGTSMKDTAPIPNTSTNIAGLEPISGSFVVDLYAPYMLSVYNIRANSITLQYSEPMLIDSSAHAINTIANYLVRADPYGTPSTLTITSIDVVSSSAVQLNFGSNLASVVHNVSIDTGTGKYVVDQASPSPNQIVQPKNLDFLANEQIKVVNAAPLTQNTVRIYFNKIPKAGNNVTGSAGCSTTAQCNLRYKINPSLGNITQAIVGTGVLANTVTITHATAQTGKAYTVIAANGISGDGFDNLASEAIRDSTDVENCQAIPKDRAGFTGLGTVIDDLGDGDFFFDPFVDGTAFSYSFTYGSRVYIGTNDTNRITYRFDPAGTNAVTATFDFVLTGTSTCSTSDTFGYGAASTCGTNMGYYGEKGVGGFTSANLNIGGTPYEMLLIGPLKTGIKQAYFTQDVDTILDWKQFTIFSTTGANAEAIHTMYGVDNNLYVAVSCSHQNFAPQVGYHAVTAPSGVLTMGTAADMTMESVNYIGKKASTPNPAKAVDSSAIVGIDSMVKYNGFLYMANNGGVIYGSNGGTPVFNSTYATYAVSGTPSGFTGTTLVLDTLSKINPGSKGIPILKEYNNKLYMVRNVAQGNGSGAQQTTQSRGELWRCNPATSGLSTACDPGDWTKLVSGTEDLGSGSNSFGMFEINGEYAYLGVDNPTSGSRVFRLKVTNSSHVPIDMTATNGTTMASASWTTFVVLDATYPNILSSTTISDGTSWFIYITAGEFGSTTKPIKIFRQKD